jgi:hypothetical protein
MHLRISALACLAACALLAEETDVTRSISLLGRDETTDIRLLAGTYASFDRVSTSTDGDPTSTDLAIGQRAGRAVELAVVHTFPRPGLVAPYVLIGGALRYARGDDDQGIRHSVIAAGFEFGGGLCLRPSRHLQLEIGPVLTIGWCDNSVEADPDAATQPEDATRSAWYGSADLRAGLWCTLDATQIGIVAGTAAHMLQLSSRVDATSPWTDTAYGGSGGFVMVGIGTRF